MHGEAGALVPRAVHSMACENAVTPGEKCHRMLFEHGTPSRRSLRIAVFQPAAQTWYSLRIAFYTYSLGKREQPKPMAISC